MIPMLNTKIVITITVAISVFTSTPVGALSYRGYQSTISCTGSAFGCSDNGNVCCIMPAGYGYSAQFDNLPAGSRGMGFRDSGCSNNLFTLFGPGTKCWNGAGARAASLMWTLSTPSDLEGRRIPPMARAISELEGRASSSDGGLKTGKNACSPDYFQYDDEAGTTRIIKVPEGVVDAGEHIANLFENKDFDALADYEAFS